MSELLHKLTTKWNKLFVYEDRLIIENLDQFRIIFKNITSQKTINIKDIKTIHFREPSFMRWGFIQFAVGGTEIETGENTVIFNKDKLKIAKRIRATVERLMSETSKPSIAPTVHQPSQADELAKFKQLADEGIISEREFEEKKKQILNS